MSKTAAKEISVEDLALLNQRQDYCLMDIDDVKEAYDLFSLSFTGSQTVPPILVGKLERADITAREFAQAASKVATTPKYMASSEDVQNLIQQWVDKARTQKAKVSKYQKLIFELQSNVANAPTPGTNGNNNPVVIQGSKKEWKPDKLNFDDGPSRARDWVVAMMCYTKSQGSDNSQSVMALFYNVDKSIQSTIRGELGELSTVMKVPAFQSTASTTSIADLILEISRQNVDVLQRRLEYTDLDWKKGVKAIDQLHKARTMAMDAELQQFSLEDNLLTKMVSTATASLRNDFLKTAGTDRSLAKFMEMARHAEQASSINRVISGNDSRPVNAMHTGQPDKKTGKASKPAKASHSSGNKKKAPNAPSSNPSSSTASRKCRYCGGPEPHDNKTDRESKCKAFKAKCTHCSKVGHFQQCCLAKKNVSSMKTINLGHINSSSGIPYMDVTVSSKSCRKKKHLRALADTGAEDAVLHADESDGLAINKAERPLISVANGQSVRAEGRTTVQLLYQGRTITARPWVVPGLSEQLYLSQRELKDMGVIPQAFPNVSKVVNSTNVSKKTDNSSMPPAINDLIKKYQDVFYSDDKELKPMKGPAMVIHLKKDVDIKPLHLSVARQVPHKYRDDLKKDLERLQAEGVIEKVTWPTTWCSPIVLVPKADGTARLTSDNSYLNKYVERPEHPFPSITEIASSIPPDAKHFTVVDLKMGYFQIPLAEESRDLTTFITPFGRWRYTRSVMGLCSSSDEFCRRTDEAFSGLQGTIKLVDDILIYGSTPLQLQKRFEAVLKKCREHSLTLSHAKVQTGTEVKFAGMIIGVDGVKVDPAKMAAIKNFRQPANITDLRSFRGLATQLASWHPDLAHHFEPLRPLLSPKNTFQWLPEHELAFNKIKDILTREDGPIRKPFDHRLKSYLYTDASKLHGMGYALIQYEGNQPDVPRLVQANSRALKAAERNYAPIELECEAINYAIQDCKLYLTGYNFEVRTDHRPLVNIFNRRHMDVCSNPRILRNLLKTAAFQFDVTYIPGVATRVADALSRFPLFSAAEDNENTEDNEDDTIMLAAIRRSTHQDRTLNEVMEEAKLDDRYTAIIKHIQDGIDKKNINPGHPAATLRHVWDNVSTDGNLIYYDGTRIVPPVNFRQKLLARLHAQHMGTSRTRALASQLYFWPGYSKQIKDLTETCEQCVAFLPSQPHEPLLQTVALQPFEAMAADLCELQGKHYMILVDRYSSYPFVEQLHKLDTKAVTKKMMKIFTNITGMPIALTVDRGPQFRTDFTEFCNNYGIDHDPSSPYNSQSNGQAEAAVKTIKTLLDKTGNNIGSDEFLLGLLEHNNTPRPDGLSPAQWAFGRRQRTRLPVHGDKLGRISDGQLEAATARRAKQQQYAKDYHDQHARDLPILQAGQKVWVQHPKTKRWKIKAVIVKLDKRQRTYTVRSGNSFYTRNRRFIRPRHKDIPDDEDAEDQVEVRQQLQDMGEEIADEPKQRKKYRRRPKGLPPTRRSKRINS